MVVKREGDRMTEERIANYNDHAKFLADIAKEILRGNKAVLDVKGVKEIIALYLLIPYITPDTLMTPDEKCVIPKLNGDFSDDITLEDLTTLEIEKNQENYIYLPIIVYIMGKYLKFLMNNK